MAAAPIPRMITSVTVVGSCVQRWHNGTSNLDITIPEGTYWLDLDYAGFAAPHGNNIFEKIQDLLNAKEIVVGDNNTWDVYAQEIGALGVYQLRADITAGSGDPQAQLDDAATTESGRALGRRLGLDVLRDDPVTPGSQTMTGRVIQGIWEPDRPEAVDIDRIFTGYGRAMRSYDGTGFGYNLGPEQGSKILRMQGLPAAYSRARSPLDVVAGHDRSFENVIWRWLAQGEMVRFFSDKTKVDWVDVATTTTSVSVGSYGNQSYAADDSVCIDGEWARVTGTAGPTLTLFRENPLAHTVGSPMGKDSFAGTFLMGESGGNCNMRQFRPVRRGSNDDRWDFSVPLIQVNHP